MSVELKNWKELCKEKDERIKELEGKFDLIVERLEETKKERIDTAYRTLDTFVDGQVSGIEYAIEICKEVGGMNEQD